MKSRAWRGTGANTTLPKKIQGIKAQRKQPRICRTQLQQLHKRFIADNDYASWRISALSESDHVRMDKLRADPAR
jgi:hypothetical protein